MEEAKIRLKKLIDEANANKIPLDQLESIKEQNLDGIGLKYKLIPLIFALIWAKTKLFPDYKQCTLSMPSELGKAFRPPEDCAFCRGKNEAPIISNISPEEFEDLFAYDGGPVIISDATLNWTALQVFSFNYFKHLYLTHDKDKKSLDCQFFPYKTNFNSLFDALKMDEDRANYRKGTEPWYFGWSNCNDEVAQFLRQHYSRPYFLPQLSENKAIDWIFMGGSGLGAHMHIDNVRLPSWQAQIKGTKEWILAPPPECLYQCEFFSVIVETGDTIVLDTNKWYHKTNVLPGEISITIGAEYD